MLPYTLGCIVLLSIMKMYNSIWRYAGYTELARTLLGSLIASLAHNTLLITVLFRRMPVSYYLMDAFFQIALVVVARMEQKYNKTRCCFSGAHML